MELDFKGRVAIVTGAGGGLGRQHALALAARGAKVLVNDLGGTLDGSGGSASAAQAVADEIRAAGGEAIANAASVTDFEAVQAMVKQAITAWGRVDILVNNAGIIRDAYFLLMSARDWRDVLEVDLNGPFHCSKEAVRIMAGRGGGVIVNIGSGLVAQPGQVNHSAAKAGMAGFSRALAREVASKGIRVMHVAPGFFKTEMSETLSRDSIEASYRLTPLERWGLPEELAALVAFLASDDARCFSGQSIAIDGGRSAVEAEFGL